jgi:hypothetical protein
MANIIVAVICNVIAAFVLLGCIFSTLRSGIAVSGLKLALAIGGGVAAFFLTPVFSGLITGVAVESTTLGAIINNLGISLGTIKSVIFLLVFMAIYLINLVICSIVKHYKIKALRNKKQNVAKIKRARSINPRAERAAKKSVWKALKAEYNAKNIWWKRLISGILGGIVGLVLGFVILMPYGYIAKDIVSANAEREYLIAGYEYTINGVIGSNVSDWILHNKEEATEELPEEPIEETPAE